MEYSSTASALMEAINKKKKQAINDGIIRAEKPLDCISDKEKPYKLPEGWIWVRLGDYALKVTDYVASGSFASLKENVLITNEPNYAIMVKTADFANGFTKNLTYTDQHGYEFLANSNLFGGELILSNIGSIGKVFIVPYLEYPMTLASNTVMVKVTDDELIKYLYYYFLSPLGQRTLKGISSGTSMMKFNKTQLKNTLVPVAPLEKQKEIVALLEKTQTIIEARRLELQKLDELIKARFVEMFGDPVANSYGLPEATLPELGEFGRGVSKHRPRNDPKLLGGDYPLIQTGDVAAANLYITSYSSTYSELGLKQSKMWDKGTLCITIAANIAKTAILDFDACFPDSVVGFTANEKTNNIFIHYWFSFFQAILESQAPESAQKNINLKILSELKVIVPDKKKQDEFVAFIKQVDKSKVIEKDEQ